MSVSGLKLTNSRRLPPQTGYALRLEAGQRLMVIDPEGEQVADLVAFNPADKGEWLSSGRSIDYANTIYMSTGHVLFSNRSRPMFTIEDDTVGRHDFLLTPCSPEMFRITYKIQGHHPSCLENLSTALAASGITADDIPTTFNIFMNVEVGPGGEVAVKAPRSRPGDHVLLRAEMPLLVGLTACSAEMSNNCAFKPIDIEIYG
jgi:uncharacterized protein YcgI (DUF1989 family)